MPIKDKIVDNLIKYILIPRNEIIDQSGFIINKVGLQNEITKLREVLLSESIFIELENKISKKYKNIGKNVLYSIGKKFCYRYGLISKFPTAQNRKAHSDFSYFLVRFLESVYSSKMEHFINADEKVFRLKMWDYIVCKKNGIGLIFADGSGAGLLSYAFLDPSIEGVQIKCEGRGDKNCEIVVALPSTLKRMKLKFLIEKDMSGLEIENSYNDINAVHETEYSRTSFQNLIDSGFFTQRTGIIKHNDERFLLLESSIIYILENELKKLKGADKVLFDISFEYGKNFVKKEDKGNFEQFIMDFLGASGFGDLMILKEKGKYKIIIRYFPWTKWAEKIDFTMIRGMISGMISGFTSKNIILKKVEKDLSEGYFSVILTE